MHFHFMLPGMHKLVIWIWTKGYLEAIASGNYVIHGMKKALDTMMKTAQPIDRQSDHPPARYRSINSRKEIDENNLEHNIAVVCLPTS
jgi:hypothetical protein